MSDETPFHCSPYRIIDDCGGAFAMGAIGGSVFHSIKGYRNAPSVSTLILFDCRVVIDV